MRLLASLCLLVRGLSVLADGLLLLQLSAEKLDGLAAADAASNATDELPPLVTSKEGLDALEEVRREATSRLKRELVGNQQLRLHLRDLRAEVAGLEQNLSGLSEGRQAETEQRRQLLATICGSAAATASASAATAAENAPAAAAENASAPAGEASLLQTGQSPSRRTSYFKDLVRINSAYEEVTQRRSTLTGEAADLKQTRAGLERSQRSEAAGLSRTKVGNGRLRGLARALADAEALATDLRSSTRQLSGEIDTTRDSITALLDAAETQWRDDAAARQHAHDLIESMNVSGVKFVRRNIYVINASQPDILAQLRGTLSSLRDGLTATGPDYADASLAPSLKGLENEIGLECVSKLRATFSELTQLENKSRALRATAFQFRALEEKAEKTAERFHFHKTQLDEMVQVLTQVESNRALMTNNTAILRAIRDLRISRDNLLDAVRGLHLDGDRILSERCGNTSACGAVGEKESWPPPEASETTLQAWGVNANALEQRHADIKKSFQNLAGRGEFATREERHELLEKESAVLSDWHAALTAMKSELTANRVVLERGRARQWLLRERSAVDEAVSSADLAEEEALRLLPSVRSSAKDVPSSGAARTESADVSSVKDVSSYVWRERQILLSICGGLVVLGLLALAKFDVMPSSKAPGNRVTRIRLPMTVSRF